MTSCHLRSLRSFPVAGLVVVDYDVPKLRWFVETVQSFAQKFAEVLAVGHVAVDERPERIDDYEVRLELVDENAKRGDESVAATTRSVTIRTRSLTRAWSAGVSLRT